MFDSGVGGLSILGAVHRRLPAATIRYVADSAYAPYGEQPETLIRDRAERITTHLVAVGARVIVVACNTATAVAIEALRAAHPRCSFVGVEPAVRPAVAASRNGHIGILATAATLRSERFKALVSRECGACQVHLQACSGLAAAIEQGRLDAPDVLALVERYAQPLREAGVDVVALGCTHYAFVRSAIEGVLGPEVQVVDTSRAVAAQVERLCNGLGQASAPGACLLASTGEPQSLQRFVTQWLDFEVHVAPQTLSV
jgi:glutamate racemase